MFIKIENHIVRVEDITGIRLIANPPKHDDQKVAPHVWVHREEPLFGFPVQFKTATEAKKFYEELWETLKIADRMTNK